MHNIFASVFVSAAAMHNISDSLFGSGYYSSIDLVLEMHNIFASFFASAAAMHNISDSLFGSGYYSPIALVLALEMHNTFASVSAD